MAVFATPNAPLAYDEALFAASRTQVSIALLAAVKAALAYTPDDVAGQLAVLAIPKAAFAYEPLVNAFWSAVLAAKKEPLA